MKPVCYDELTNCFTPRKRRVEIGAVGLTLIYLLCLDLFCIPRASWPIPEPSSILTLLTLAGLALCFGLAGWWRKRPRT